MSAIEILDASNWLPILKSNYVVQSVPTNPDRYFPLAPIYLNPSSTRLLVGTFNEKAESHWYLGARLYQYLYISPDLQSGLVSGVQAAKVERARLNTMTLVEFNNYGSGSVPYTLKIEIPTWHEQMYLEVWEYQGNVGENQIELDTSDIIERLQNIESKIDNQYYGY